MARYRQRGSSLRLRAVRWLPGKDHPGVQHDKGGAFLVTMHNGQKVYLQPGDCIIPEADGVHCCPVKASVFEMSYEQITSD